MSAWSIVSDGFAVGPERVFTEAGRRVVLTPVWSDEDGVCVDIDAGTDEPLPADLAERVAVGIIQLAALPAPLPEFSAT